MACAVRSSLLPTRRSEPDRDTETLIIQLGRPRLTVAVCYRPPSDDTSLERMIQCLASLPGTTPLLVMGDFNLPEVQWRARPDDGASPDLTRNSGRATRFLEQCGLLGVSQYVAAPTRGPNVLDLVLARGLQQVTAHSRAPGIASDHQEVVVGFTAKTSGPARPTRSQAFSYRRADFDGLRQALSVTPWELLDDVSVDEAVSMFYALLDAAVHDYVPIVTLTKRFPPWFTDDVRRALRAKQASFERMKRHPNDEHMRANFVQSRSVFKRLSSQSYTEYLKGVIGDFTSNPKRFWSFLKCFKQTKSASVLENGGVEVTDDVERANLLNQAFAKKFSSSTVTVFPNVPSCVDATLNDFYVSEDIVRSLLQDLVVGKACGPDGLSARILRECAVELAVPLCKIFRMSLSKGIFPEKWAEANIVPIHKKGSRRDPGNYRSISLLPLCAKAFEKVICDQLYQHTQPFLSPLQHGFIQRRSCSSNLASFLAHGWTAIQEGVQLDTIYTDFSSAFQSVNHRLLLYKLHRMYGLEGNALKWLSSYLGRRKQRVVLNGKVSDWVPVTSGTPEGGHLSPLLFALFVNDLPTVIATNCLMFCDDVKIFHKVASLNDVITLQNDLNAVGRWAADWRLVLNASKCKAFKITLKRNFVDSSYTINGTKLENVKTIRDLGVIIDQKLTFEDHINTTVRKANRALGLLIRTLQSASRRCSFKKSSALAAFNSNVRPILEYCSVIWAGAAKTHLVRVERVQHRFLMWLASHTDPHCPSLEYHRLLQFYDVRSLRARRAQSDVMFLVKLFKGLISSSHLLTCFSLHVPSRSTRVAAVTLFNVPRGRVNATQSSMFVRAPRLVNEFVSCCPSSDIFHDSLGKLKKAIVNQTSTLETFI